MVTDDFVGEITVRPVWWNHPPQVSIALDGNLCWSGLIESEFTWHWCESLPRGQHNIEVRFSGKTNTDTTADNDHAVVIEHLDFFGVRDDRFRWQGIYTPDYPEPWRTQQIAQGIMLLPELKAHSYLGWNGVWRLEFSTPIFTWMHRVLGLGWIY